MLRRCLFHTLPNFSSYWLMVFAATVRSATATVRPATASMRSATASMGRATASMGRATARRCGVRGAARPATAALACCRCPTTSTISCINTSTAVSTATATVVASSSPTAEAMITPAVAIAPIRPWAYAKEDPVIKIARAIKTHGCASVWRIVIVAV